MAALLLCCGPDVLHALGVSLPRAVFECYAILCSEARQGFCRLSILPIRHLGEHTWQASHAVSPFLGAGAVRGTQGLDTSLYSTKRMMTASALVMLQGFASTAQTLTHMLPRLRYCPVYTGDALM